MQAVGGYVAGELSMAVHGKEQACIANACDRCRLTVGLAVVEARSLSGETHAADAQQFVGDGREGVFERGKHVGRNVVQAEVQMPVRPCRRLSATRLLRLWRGSGIAGGIEHQSFV